MSRLFTFGPKQKVAFLRSIQAGRVTQQGDVTWRRLGEWGNKGPKNHGGKVQVSRQIIQDLADEGLVVLDVTSGVWHLTAAGEKDLDPSI
jgi:ribosomal protein S19E (S16A)